MDPISIIGGVAAILHIGHALYVTTRSLNFRYEQSKLALKDIEEFIFQTNIFSHVLKNFHSIISKAWDILDCESRLQWKSTVREVKKYCKCVHGGLEQITKKFEHVNVTEDSILGTLGARLHWSFIKPNITEFRLKLQGAQLTVTLLTSILNLNILYEEKHNKRNSEEMQVTREFNYKRIGTKREYSKRLKAEVADHYRAMRLAQEALEDYKERHQIYTRTIASEDQSMEEIAICRRIRRLSRKTMPEDVWDAIRAQDERRPPNLEETSTNRSSIARKAASSSATSQQSHADQASVSFRPGWTGSERTSESVSTRRSQVGKPNPTIDISTSKKSSTNRRSSPQPFIPQPPEPLHVPRMDHHEAQPAQDHRIAELVRTAPDEAKVAAPPPPRSKPKEPIRGPRIRDHGNGIVEHEGYWPAAAYASDTSLLDVAGEAQRERPQVTRGFDDKSPPYEQVRPREFIAGSESREAEDDIEHTPPPGSSSTSEAQGQKDASNMASRIPQDENQSLKSDTAGPWKPVPPFGGAGGRKRPRRPRPPSPT